MARAIHFEGHCSFSKLPLANTTNDRDAVNCKKCLSMMPALVIQPVSLEKFIAEGAAGIKSMLADATNGGNEIVYADSDSIVVAAKPVATKPRFVNNRNIAASGNAHDRRKARRVKFFASLR